MIEVALDLARNSHEYPHRLACILTDRKGRIVSKATNHYSKSHPVQAYWAKRVGQPNRVNLHAEMKALIASRRQAHAAYVVRLTRSGSIGLAKPCPICEAALRDSGIQVVYYTTNNNTVKRMKL